MFEKIRKPGRGKAILAYIIFGTICLVFVFLGMTPQGTGFVSGGAAAIVNNQIISQKDYRERVRQAESSLGIDLNQLPAANRKMFNSQIRQRAMEELIQMELLAQAASEEGIYTSDVEVRDFIMNISFFSENGRFQRVRYDTYLKNVQMTAGQFESMIRRDLSRQKVRDVLIKALEPATIALNKDRAARNTKVEISFLSFSRSGLLNSLKVSASDVAQFQASEEGQKKIKGYYESHKSDYVSPEQIKVSHILINADKGHADAEKSALKKIKEVRERLQSDDFGKVAQSESQDEFSKKNQGDLGWVKRGDMPKEFEQAAFALQKDVISAPVQSDVGYHLIKVVDKKEKVQKELSEVEGEIAQSLVKENLVDQAIARFKEEAASGKISPNLLKKYSLKWEKTEEFPVGATAKNLSDEKVISEILGKAREDQVVPELIESNGSYYVAKLEKVVWPESQEKEDPRFLASRRAGDVLSKWLREMEQQSKIERNASLLQ
ncbi:MAG: SurA N-terminal domain-containing protein [Bdellovibrionales bacterium]|nr:SurA N-terminal domain-containing protein [Bdellovibrionales bacterium]